jgi:hypothetical protein
LLGRTTEADAVFAKAEELEGSSQRAGIDGL